jgi:nitroreductase
MVIHNTGIHELNFGGITVNRDLLQGILNMESAQKGFNAQAVTPETLEMVIKGAVRAPNASNRQSYSIIAIDDRAKIRKFFAFDAPCALLFCVDYNRVADTANFLGEEYEVNGIVSLMHGTVDTCLAAQNAALTASALGLGQLVTNSLHRRPLDELYKGFDLPEKYCFPLIVLLLGYTDYKRDYRKGRLTDLGVVHRNSYRRLSGEQLAELTAYIDDPENHMPPGAEMSPGESFLRWYFTHWPNKANARQQEAFMDRLRRSGFAV